MSSINFNASAQVALSTLNTINKDLNTLNDQISTGKKVNNARDNAAIYSIATTISADVSSLGKVQESLSLASSTLGVARSASESIVSLLEDAQGLIVDAQTKSESDRNTIQTDLANIKTQIQDITEAASFNGINLVDGAETAAIEFLSSLNRTSSGVATDTISVGRQNLSQTAASFGASAKTTAGAYTGGFTSNSVAGTFGSDVLTAGDAISDGEVETVLFSADTIATGESFRVSLSVGGADDVVAEYVAKDGDTSNEVVLGLKSALDDAIVAAGFTTAEVTVSASTSANPSQNDVSLSITNNTGSDYNAASVYTETTGGTAGGLLSDLNGLTVAGSDLTNAESALSNIDDILSNAIDAAAAFGSAQKRIDTQSSFISSLVDNLNSGISSLTDADLTQASADLSRVQTQQQLGLSALSIANQAPQSILALFR